MPLEERLVEQAFWSVELALLGPGELPAGIDRDRAQRRIEDYAGQQPASWAATRWARLRPLLDGGSDCDTYATEYGLGGVRRFAAGDGTDIWQLKLETFPGHINNVYLLVRGDDVLLWDVGSGADSSTRDLHRSFFALQRLHGVELDLSDIGTAVISHGHLDHYGGAEWIRANTNAALLIHELDLRVVAYFQERFAVAARDVARYFEDVGVPESEHAELVAMYTATKDRYNSVPVDAPLVDGETIGPGYEVIHVPGHCPGLICLRVGDVLLAADHILARITPLQSPEAITPYTGLGHYFESLDKIQRFEGIRLTLPAHETPIDDVGARIEEIRAHHEDRLAKVESLCAEPQSVWSVTTALFGQREGYSRILAVLEAGAHIEYLFQRGRLRVANVREVATTEGAIRYIK